MADPLDRYRRRYFGGGDPLARYRQRYGFGSGLAPSIPEVETPSLASELWKRTKEVGGGIFNVTSAGVGALGGLGAGALGSDVYQRVLERKAQAAALEDPDPDVLQNLEIAPKVGELVTEDWQPPSKGGQALKNVASLAATLGTDPASFIGVGAAARGLSAAARSREFGAARGLGVGAAAIYGPDTARGAYEGGRGALESLGAGEYADAAGQGVESILLGGLSALMAKGVINEAGALRALNARRRAAGEAPKEIPPDSFFDSEPVQQDVPPVFQETAAASAEAPPFEAAEQPFTPVDAPFDVNPFGPADAVRLRRGRGLPMYRTEALPEAAPAPRYSYAPRIAEDVPSVFLDTQLPDGEVPPVEVGRFGEPPAAEYIPPVFRREAAAPVPAAPRRARRLRVVEPPAPEPMVAEPQPVEEPPIPGVITPEEAVAGQAPARRIAQLDEWIDGIDQSLEDGESPALQSLKAEMVAERERLAAPPVKGKLEAVEDVPPIALVDELPTGDIPAGREPPPPPRTNPLWKKAEDAERRIDELLKQEPISRDTTAEIAATEAFIATRSRGGFSAKELAKELGIDEGAVRAVREKAGVTAADVVAGRKTRFAKPAEAVPPPAQDAPPPPVAAAAEPVATPEVRDPLFIAQDFLAGKKAVLEGEIRDHLKANGVGGLDIKSTLRRLENLGVITKGKGKTRLVRQGGDAATELPAEAAATEEAAAEPSTLRADADWIPMADLEVGGVYRVRFGNFETAVYAGDGHFIGVREKGHAKRLDVGDHPETGTELMAVQPLEKIGQVPEGIPLERRIGTGPRDENKALFDYLEGKEPAVAEPTPPTRAAEPAPLTPEQQARQDLYVDPATGKIRPEVERSLRQAAGKFVGTRSRDRAEIIGDMRSHLPEVLAKFDPEKGELLPFIYNRMVQGERNRWKSIKGEVERTESLDAPAPEGGVATGEKVGIAPNQETGPAAARKEFAERTLREVLNELPPEDQALAYKIFFEDKTNQTAGRELGISKQAANKRLHDRVFTALAAKLKERGITGAEGHTPDSTAADGWEVAAAEAMGSVHPIADTGLTFVDTPHLPGGHAQEMSQAREIRKLGTLISRLYDEVQAEISTPGKSKFAGFMAGTNSLGVHIGDKSTRAGGRVFLNLFRHAEAAAANPVRGLRPQEFSRSVVDTVAHEVLHNEFPHGPEMVAVERAVLERMLRDGSYAKATNAVKQTVTAHDGYLMKWLEDRAAFGEKNYVESRATLADVRRPGAGRAPAEGDRPGAGAAQAGAGAGGRPAPEGDLRGGVAREALELGPGAPIRGGRPDPDRDIALGRRLRVEARLEDDPIIRAARDAFTSKTLKDIDPIKLISMMPEISGKFTPEIMSKMQDAFESIGPSDPRAKPQGTPDISLNLSKLNIDDDLKQKLTAMHQVMKEAGIEPRAKTEHWATAEQLEEALSAFKDNKDFITHVKRYGVTPTELTLFRMLHVFQASKARQANMVFKAASKTLTAAAEKGESTALLLPQAQRAAQAKFIEMAHLSQISLDLSGQKSKVGRLLQVMKQPVDDLDPMLVNFSEHAKFLKALELEGVGRDARNKIHQLLISNDPAAYDEALKFFHQVMKYSTTEQVMEGYVAGLVSGVPTKIANFTSNLLFRGIRDAENLIAVGIDTARSAIKGTPRERYLGEAAAALHGYKFHVEQALKDWVSAHGEIATLKPLTPRGLRFITGSPLDELIRSGGKIPGKAGEVLRYGFKSMEADDGLFKHLGGAQELWRRLYRIGRVEGLDHDAAIAAMEPRVKKIQEAYESGELKALGKPTLAMLKDVNRQVLSDTFQSPLEGLMAKVQLVSNHHPMTKLLVPFIKTPTNIFIQTWKRTPLGLIQSFANRAKYTEGQWAEELSKGLLGTTIAGGIALMAYEWANESEGKHQITGSGPLDPKLAAQLKATGWQPYSFKVGDRYVPYTRAEPLSSILGIAADMAHAVKDGETRDVNKFGQRLIKSVTTNLANKTFVSGITAAAQAWGEPGRYMDRFLSQFESGIIPLSGLSRTLTRATDPYFRDTGGAFETTGGIPNPIIANIPGASRLLPAQFDPSGEPRKRAGSSAFERAVSPIPTTVEDRTPRGNVLRLLTDIGYAPAVKDSFDTRKFGKVDLTPDEKAALYGAHAAANERLESLIENPSFQALPNSSDDLEAFGGRKTKEDVVRSIHSKYYKAALSRIRPALLRRAIEQHRVSKSR